MTRKLSPLPLTELGRRCSASTSMPLLTAPGRPRGFTRVTCDLPARHGGMHEHVIHPGRSFLDSTYGAQPALVETEPRETYAWPPRLVAFSWWIVDRFRSRV